MSIFDKLIDITSDSRIIGLTKELKSMYISKLFSTYKKSILVVNNSLYEANLIYQSLQNYTDKVLFFPMDDFLTSEAIAASPELSITRLETLNTLLKKENYIVVTNLMGYLRFLPKKSIYEQSILSLKINHEYNMNIIIQKLNDLGYSREPLVEKTGDYAVRGFVIDVFPVGCENPIRLEYFGDEIQSIRTFNVETQRTIHDIQNTVIYPYYENIINLNDETLVSNISGYFDNYIVVYNEYSEIKQGYSLLEEDILNYKNEQNIESSKKYMFSFDELSESGEIFFEKYDENINSVDNTIIYNSYQLDTFESTIVLKKYLNQNIKSHKTIVICLSNRYSLNKVEDYLKNEKIIVTNENEIYENYINLIVKNISEGFILNNYIFISERELFNRKSNSKKYNSKFRYGKKIRDINKLNIGDYIVHNTHGIGKYLGLSVLIKNGLKKDYLVLEYKGGDKLYIPVEKIESISKYSSNEGLTPPLNKLGGTEWAKTKMRIQKKLENMAGELLELYALREASVGFSFLPDSKEQLEFEKEFKYTETEDQIKVINEIKKDMEDIHPMDRLLCGDVGFGKTEVAFRAMFKAIMSGKQVAYLCPTTILSSQHYNSALERFSSFAVNIGLLNRFTTGQKLVNLKEGIKNGAIDIVIGTHRLLSDDISFKNLGLLVIDEEQRFGVKQKEQIKKYKNNIDILTLSATPIPRTLQMSMTGIRSLSLIETPPYNRYPIQTYVLQQNKAVIKDAIYKELSRNGQVFILYNHVQELNSKAMEISALVPDAKIVCAHGRMTKAELENTMMEFIQKKYDILLCTTIIETGIDIPNVNTLIIMDADKFGLSQLYQIRGRVGRSDKIAYCYLMYKQGKVLTEIAQKRLDVIKEFTQLGSGFSIAMRDLSIRGAGDLLGSEQAGFIDSIGIELYLKMLNDEIAKLQGKNVIEPSTSNMPLVDVGTTISDDYVSDVDVKIEIHKKINTIDSLQKLEQVKDELEDRFGNVSDSTLIYMYEELFEKYAEKLSITKVRQTKNFIEVYLPFDLVENLDIQNLFLDVTNLSRMFRFSTKQKQVIITLDIVGIDKHFIYYLVDLAKIIENNKKKK